MVLGIDVGGSTTKIVGLKPNGECIGMMQVEAGDQITSAFGAFGKFTSTYQLPMGDIQKIMVTGVGASYLENGMYNIPTQRVDEFLAIGLGGLNLAGLSEAIIVSVGTGTALVRATPRGIAHLGGSGVGGGTLINLAERFAGAHSIASIIHLAESGKLSEVDLRLSDISKETIGNLPPCATVSNFGNIQDTATSADIALGLINMIFESIGMMAVFATLNDTVKDVVIIGSLSVFEHAASVFDTLAQLYPGLRFHIPPDAIFATAVGAALSQFQ
ncbi:MAG: pantothenate kinase [Defluviitaleaceae bacterium]|nr:pantothenate kinase [Defluviitaleaceae bacterium]